MRKGWRQKIRTEKMEGEGSDRERVGEVKVGDCAVLKILLKSPRRYL